MPTLGVRSATDRLGAAILGRLRIVHLTAGTGSFFCGTCLRDNALVTELRALGHEVVMVPMYLPIIVDEAAAADAPVFFGGVNVYLQQLSSLFRHTPRAVDALFDAPWVLRQAAKRSGSTQPSELGPLTLSMLEGERGRQAKELDRLVAWLAEGPGRGADWIVLSNALLAGLARRSARASVFASPARCKARTRSSRRCRPPIAMRAGASCGTRRRDSTCS